MRRARWLAPWKDCVGRPVIYHCITRVVERHLAFGKEKKEDATAEMARMEQGRDVAPGKMLRCRDRFGTKRKDGARPLRGSGAAAAGRLWSVRDLRRQIG